MRVLHLVTTDAFAGVERYLTYIAPAQVEAGMEVTVLGGDQARMSAALTGTGVRYGPASLGPRTWRRARRAEVDLLHAHMTHAEVLGLVAAGRAPVVATRHFARPRGTSVVGRLADRFVTPRLAREVAISQFVADHAGVDTEVVLNAVPHAPMGAHDGLIVLVAQRLEAEKDTATALHAWARSRLANDGWRMTVAGRGAQRSDLEDLVDTLGVGSSVDLVGFVDDLPGLMANAGVLLATASAEPFGLTVAEAMACGLPVVAARGGSHLETVGRVDPRALFRSGDAGDAAAVLRAIVHDQDHRRAISPALQGFARDELSIDSHVQRLRLVYEAAIGAART